MAKYTPQAEMPLSDQVRVRSEKLDNLRAEGLDPFQQTKFETTSTSAEVKNNFDTMEGKTVSLAGRIMSKRGMGKVVFCDLQDCDGRVQSCRSQKITLPMPRLLMIRPARETVLPSMESKLFFTSAEVEVVSNLVC